jgi:hypothetical protein
MADANDTVQAALESALAGSDAETQSASGSSPEVTEALQEALKVDRKVDEQTSDDSTDESTEEDGKAPKTVPYDRLSKVVRQKNEISERFSALEEKFKTVTEREETLRGRVGNLEQDSQILDAIKNLAQDEKYRDHVVAIDKALQGIEEDIEAATDQKDEQKVTAAEKRFEAKTAELDNLLQDQRAETLWNEAREAAKSMLDALPDEYTDDDRAIIGKLWTPRVDWKSIDEQGSEGIPAALNSSFAVVLKEYKTPRGALVAQTTKEIEARVPDAKIVSPEDKVKGILEKDWDKLEDGKPALSDDDFTNNVAELLRATRGES